MFHCWVKISAATAMALGTSVGGWKIIKTMGTKIFKIEPINGFAADIDFGFRYIDGYADASAGQYDACYHLRDSRRRQREALLSREMGIGRTDHRIVDYYDTDHDGSGSLDLQGYCFVYVIGLQG